MPPDPAIGLTTQDAERRLAEVGPNDPARGRGTTILGWLLTALSNPLVLVLLAASAVAGVLGQHTDASIIVVMVVLSIVLNLVQTTRSHRAAERLRQTVAPTARVLRDGRWIEIPRRNVVPGDVVRLAAGDRVPADGRLLETRDLHVQEAALTGESLPVEKTVGGGNGDRHRVFLGTSVVSGTAIVLVTETGARTAFGDIAARLSTRPPETEFERGTRQFALLIMRTVVLLVLFVVLAGVVLRHPPFETLLFAVALAVGLTPEFLPMITSVTLANGAVHMARRKVVVRHLEAIENFGSMDVLCCDKTGTLTSGEMVLERRIDALGQPSDRAFELAYLNSAHETGITSPLDRAILDAGPCDITRYVKLDEVPFDFDRRRLSVVVEHEAGRLLVTKGAPESVVPLCATYEAGGSVRPIDGAARQKIESAYQALSSNGARVLAVAWTSVRPQPAYGRDDERALTLVGFVSFFDPPMRGVKEALRALAESGVTVKVITGDNDLVARHVCAEVGLDVGRVVTGTEIERMSDGALAATVDTVTLFARISPAQKSRLILALKQRDHVVGFLGDGINDAPSLHTADVGISVANAVDVARDAADIILLERNLDVLHAGIREGRRAFGNVMKYLLMGTSSNFGNMFSMAAAFLFLPFLPMLPTQILLNNFLYDLAHLHGDARADQLPLRLRHVRRAALRVSRVGGDVSYRVVRGVALHADARALRHPHRGTSAPEPPQHGAHADHARRGGARNRAPLLPRGHGHGLRAALLRLLRVPRSGHARLPRARRAGEAPPARGSRAGCRVDQGLARPWVTFGWAPRLRAALGQARRSSRARGRVSTID